MSLKEIAFVAMPFGKKPTGLTADKGPTMIDFDKLWDRAFYPALDKLGYMPIRADNQVGSVIIKDMLEMLVHADLVLADISIPNGNVYYEAGVRHAARENGCVLLTADWSRPLFDLKQITQLRYPSVGNRPTSGTYDKIASMLVKGIPPLVQSTGPVFELTKAKSASSIGSRQLKEISTAVFNFQTDLKTAKLEAKSQNKDRLRSFLDEDYLNQLPTYAITELVEAVRDNLNWDELLGLLNRLPDKLLGEPFFLEQKAIGSGRKGKLNDAIALLEQIRDKYGETPERLGMIGSRYRELARTEKQKGRKSQLLAKAIRNFKRGKALDLNDYYCSYKLLVTLLERNRPGDREEALECANHVFAACNRIRELDLVDEWVEPSLLVHAFATGDVSSARELGNTLLETEWANWRLGSIVKDLKWAMNANDEDAREPFKAILDELASLLPVSQEELMEEVLPLIKADGALYQKSVKVDARPAVEGEIVISITEDGEETSQAAKAGQMLIRNMTTAREEYLVDLDKFTPRYKNPEPIDGEEKWQRYNSSGQVRAIQVTPEITTLLNVGSEFFIHAPWGTDQIVKENDFLVSTCPTQDEIYRIAKDEFQQTYTLVSDL